MSFEAVRPGPIDCLQRGLRSLRANWQLVPALAVQLLVILGLTAAGLLALLTGMGIGVVAWLRDLGPDWPQRLAEDLAMVLESAPPPLLPLLLPLAAATAVWTVAFAVGCYLQGGLVGLLAEAESAAGPGLPSWREFRNFSLSRFDRHGRRLFWRYFWLDHLIGAVVLVWALLALVWLLLAAQMAGGGAVTLGVAVGCVGLVPLLLLLFLVSLWSIVATVEAVRPGASVLEAGRRGLDALRRRFVAVLVLGVLGLVGSMAVSAMFAPLRWGAALALGDRLLLSLGTRGALAAAETLASCALTVILVAALVALLGPRRPQPLEAA